MCTTDFMDMHLAVDYILETPAYALLNRIGNVLEKINSCNV